MIQLRDVVKMFGSQCAVDRVNLDCEQGKTQVLIGTSGCGKSTLLRMIVGLETPDQGEIYFAGLPLGKQSLPEVRHRIGYMIQEGGLFPHLSARDNVALLPRYLRWEQAQTSTRIEYLARLVQLPMELLERFPRQLSGGQRQRVSLMRALMLDPEVLLLDEPLGDLDPMIRAELQTDLKQIFGKLQKTVVLVTHDLAEAGYLGDRLTLLQRGQIVQQGTISDFIERPANDFAAKFVQAQRQLI